MRHGVGKITGDCLCNVLYQQCHPTAMTLLKWCNLRVIEQKLDSQYLPHPQFPV
jgi:hypothetical protein